MDAIKQFKFETAHRLVKSYSKECRAFHGHSYKAEIVLCTETLNDDGMVMDFKLVKHKMSHLFDSFDHSMVLWNNDMFSSMFEAMAKMNNEIRLIIVDYNPTAENMAHHFFRACIENQLPVKEVKVKETDTGWVVANRPKPFVGESVRYWNIPERTVNE